MRPRRSASTCAALVGETWPERLAEGATTGPPKAAQDVARDRMRGHAHGDSVEPGEWRDRPPRNRAALRSTSVSGPGQNAAASFSAAALKTAEPRAASISATCAIRGLNAGRPLAA